MAGAGDPSLLVADVQSMPQSVDEIKEYEKILRISHDIFAGTHPRLKVPEQFVCKAPSRTLQSSVAPASLEHAGTQKAKTAPADPLPTKSRVSHLKATSSSATSPASSIAPKSTSGIDPIFLTKSDDLVRAEIQLQRKRIENALKEQAERSKFDTRQKTAAHEGRPDVDVSDVLNQALEIVKPFPSPDISGTNDAMVPSDSVDENSLYSSRAPDSPLPWDYEKDSLSEQDRQGRGLTGRENIAHPINARRVAEIDSHTLQGTTDKAILPQGLNQPTRGEKHKQQQQEELLPDEPEYSPPEPAVPMVDNRGDDEYQPPEVIVSARPNTLRHVEQNLPQQSSLSPNVRVVRNHITSPAAPQPSRVSPLATAKGPSVQRMLHTASAQRDYIEGGPLELYSGRRSPEAPPSQQLLPRKRRRVQESRGTAGMRLVDTPEPRIKLEPVSPPPFHDTASRPYLNSDRPVYIDISSPRYASSGERREVISREPIYELDRGDLDSPAEASVRAVSRLSVRRPMRDSQDLRRVASLHNARNPDNTNRELIEPVLRPQSTRASPYVVVERQPNEKVAYYEDAAPTYSRRYAHYEDYPLPSRYREFYVEDDAGRRYIEPGPARRIVVDEYGNQYYEMVPASKIRPTPSIPARVVRPDEYAERAYVPSASIRGASIVEDGYGNRRYIQEMAPPPTGTYRRVAEHGRNVSESQRLYPSRAIVDRESAFRSGSVAVDYAPRPATYIEEEIPRDRLVRTSSVRPPPSRYEQHRVHSVRPTGREMSVYMDEDGHRVAREYSERPGFTTVRPEREGRYITDEDGTRLAIDGARDVVHRVVPRY